MWISIKGVRINLKQVVSYEIEGNNDLSFTNHSHVEDYNNSAYLTIDMESKDEAKHYRGKIDELLKVKKLAVPE